MAFSGLKQVTKVLVIALRFSAAASAPASSTFPNNDVTLNFSDSPPSGSQVLDGSFQSFSIEYAYMADFGGNLRSVV